MRYTNGLSNGWRSFKDRAEGKKGGVVGSTHDCCG